MLLALPAAAQDATTELTLPAFETAPLTSSAAAPFVLDANSPTLPSAVHCLTQAIYYEAGAEPLAGRQAVAQVVLNRMRHPAFPKSVCGVVFEGAERHTGCQFTFTCDGSLARTPNAARWDEAERVAIGALAGGVAESVGGATHYHAAWMTPYWSPSLVEIARIGGHVFYRMPGARGDPAAFTGRYSGQEPATVETVAFAAKPAGPAPRRGRRTAKAAAPSTADFTIWGLQVATVDVQHGEVSVRNGS